MAIRPLSDLPMRHENWRMDIGKVIRGMRKERGATLEQVAFDAGTDASNLSRVERGKQKPSAEALTKIAKALGSDLQTIYAIAASDEAPHADAEKFRKEDFAPDAVELRRLFRLLTPENRRLAVEQLKLLVRLQQAAEA